MCAVRCKRVHSSVQLPENLTADHRQLLVDLFDWLVQPCLDYVRLHCKTLLSSSPSHLVVMLIRLYHCLLDEVIVSSNDDIETLTSSQVSSARGVYSI